MASTLTDSEGNYMLCNLSIGMYTVAEMDLEDFDTVYVIDGGNSNLITVMLGPGEHLTGNKFVNAQDTVPEPS